MGSAILAYPAMKAIQREYPGAELFFLIFAKNRASVDILNQIPRENVLTIREKSLGSFLADVIKTVARMHREQIEVVFDLELFTRVTAILTYLSGAPVRVGFHKFRMEGLYRGTLHTHRIQYNFQQHISKSFLSFLDVLRYPAKDWPTMDAAIRGQPSGNGLVSGLGIGKNPDPGKNPKTVPRNSSESDQIIILNPSAGEIPIRAWPLENYVELARRLLRGPRSGAGPDGGRSRPKTTDLVAEKFQTSAASTWRARRRSKS